MQFTGLGVAMVTPFLANGEIDYSALEKLTEHLIVNDCNYLVVQGTTGETPTLTEEEKRKSLDFIIEINKKRLPIVLGVGGNNTRELVHTFETYNFKGVDGILSASPNYNKPTQEGIYQHYKALATACTLPIILYNVPGRTASNMLPATTLRLANDFSNIVAIKEACGNMEQIMQIIKDKPEGFSVISGDDPLVMPFVLSGGQGLISVIGNAFPKQFSKLIKAALNGDIETAKSIHYRFYDLIPMLFEEGNPGGIKEVLKVLNICQPHVRLPLVNTSENLNKRIYNWLAANDLN